MPAERRDRTRHRSKYVPSLRDEDRKDDERSQGRRSRSTKDTPHKDLPSLPSGLSHSQTRERNDGLPKIDYHKRLEQRVRELQQELDIAKKELSLAKQEVQLNRVFGNKADAVSEADIKVKAEHLNDCIFQLTSTIAEALENVKFRSSPNGDTVQFFGDPLVKLVKELRPKLTHASALISLQACLSHFCHKVLSSEFSSIVNTDRNDLLQNIFDDMKALQPKVVSARWRSLTLSHSQGLQDQQQLCQLLIHRLTNLYGFPAGALEFNYGKDFSNLVNVTLDLHKMMYKDYVSGDIEPFSPPPRSPFDSERMEVDDPKGSATKAIDGPILCTTSIGLARKLVVRLRQGDQFVDQEDRLVLLKAKILMNLDD